MNERVVPKMTNSHVVKLSNSRANAPDREVPVPRRQDVVERPCVPRLELNGPTLRHFESQPDSPRINQRFLKRIDKIGGDIAIRIIYSDDRERNSPVY